VHSVRFAQISSGSLSRTDLDRLNILLLPVKAIDGALPVIYRIAIWILN